MQSFVAQCGSNVKESIQLAIHFISQVQNTLLHTEVIKMEQSHFKWGRYVAVALTLLEQLGYSQCWTRN